MERRVLGKGLSALIPGKEEKVGERIVHLEIDQIKPNRFQPREGFNQEKLEELIASIKEKGVIQPVLVRGVAEGYELIAGERRLRAARFLHIAEVPAIIKDVTDFEALELSLIENIQREDLNPIDQAYAYKRLIDEFEFTQDRLAQAIGKDRSSIANTIRLLKLPLKVQKEVKQGRISMGHGRALLAVEGINEQIRLCDEVISKRLSVRELENLVKCGLPREKVVRRTKEKRDAHLVAVEEELQHILGTRVRIIQGPKRGRIQIEYYSQEDLERILGTLRGR